MLRSIKGLENVHILRPAYAVEYDFAPPMVATTRILIPKARVRLSAGRKNFSTEAQLLCLIAGANSIFYGDSLLTTKNNEMEDDRKLISQFSKKDLLKSNNSHL